MKPNLIETPFVVDRLATADEIRAAVLPVPDPIEEYAMELLREIPSDTGGYVRVSAAEFEVSSLLEPPAEEQDEWPN